MIRWLMERLAERVAAIVAASFSSTVETMHALGQAEQQGQLEEAARRYESDGMPEVAQTLRQRAARLTSDDPAAQALPIADNLAAGARQFRPAALDAPNETASSETPRLESPKPRRRRKSTKMEEPPFSSPQS